jgi:hypothetical protein
MSAAVIFVMLMATAVTWPIDKFILQANDLTYLRTITFILVIASLGGAAVCSQGIACYGGAYLYLFCRIVADNIVGRVRPYDERRQVVYHGDAHGNKYTQHLA